MKQILTDAGRAQLSDAVARSFDLDPAQADTAIRQLTDAVTFRMERNMLSRGGVADMTSLLVNPDVGTARAPDSGGAQGNEVLDVLIGNKHVSRGIAARAASMAGIDASAAEKILPIVANAVIGTLRKEAGPELQQIAFGIDAGNPLPLPGERPTASTGPTASPSSSGTQPTSAGHPDYGNPLPLPGEPPRRSRSSRRQPEPQQPDDQGPDGQDGEDEESSPYDRLPDIVRRGGTPAPGGGGSIEDVIRNILNSLLGNGNRGVIGTMIQLFIIRFLASLVRRFFSRLGGR